MKTLGRVLGSVCVCGGRGVCSPNIIHILDFYLHDKVSTCSPGRRGLSSVFEQRRFKARSANRLSARAHDQRRTRSDTSVRESLEVNHIRQQLIETKLDTNIKLLQLVLVSMEPGGLTRGARRGAPARCAKSGTKGEREQTAAAGEKAALLRQSGTNGRTIKGFMLISFCRIETPPVTCVTFPLAHMLASTPHALDTFLSFFFYI